jgi:hypothetical protein
MPFGVCPCNGNGPRVRLERLTAESPYRSLRAAYAMLPCRTASLGTDTSQAMYENDFISLLTCAKDAKMFIEMRIRSNNVRSGSVGSGNIRLCYRVLLERMRFPNCTAGPRLPQKNLLDHVISQATLWIHTRGSSFSALVHEQSH